LEIAATKPAGVSIFGQASSITRGSHPEVTFTSGKGTPITREKSLNTGQWHRRDQLVASLPQRGFGLSFFFSFGLDLHADEARHAANASLADIGRLRRLALIEGLAEGLREEHDEAAEPKRTFAGCHQSAQKMAG
jgi:hypothetical protein